MTATNLESGGLPVRPASDVSGLPTVTFGQRSLMWWGTLGYMTIEGWSLALLVATYFYLRQNFETWPPLGTPSPSLLIPTINLALLVVSIWPTWLAAERAKRLDTDGVKRWLMVCSVLSLPILILRWFELWALNVRWDSNAYGSVAWITVGFQTSLLVLDVADTVGLAIFYWTRRMPVKVMSDVADNSFYWYFTVGSWVPIYAIMYVGPRVF